MSGITTFGATIKKLREDKGMAIDDVATQLEISVSDLQEIENNQRSASRKHLPILASVLDIDKKKLKLIFLSDKSACL